MKTPSNRILKNPTTQQSSNQTQNGVRNGRRVPTPADPLALLRAKNALGLLKTAAAAAIALAKLNASRIEYGIANNAGWENFDSVMFLDGNAELPRFYESEISRFLASWQINIGGDKELLWAAKVDTENLVYAICYLIETQGNEICDHRDGGSYHAAMLIARRLKESFDAAFKAAHVIGPNLPESAVTDA